MNKIFINGDLGSRHPEEALILLTDSFIQRDEFCNQTVIDLRECLSNYISYSNKLAAGLPMLPADIENLRESNVLLADENIKLYDLIREFFKLLNIREVSMSEREFSPNFVSSCRVFDQEKMGKILTELGKIINYESPKVTKRPFMQDHQIAELVNLITKDVRPICENQSLRARISRVVVKFFKKL